MAMGSQGTGTRPREGIIPNPKLKFFDQCREVMRFKQFSRRTEETYLQWIRRFILFHRRPAGGGKWIWRHPRDMGAAEVRAFLTYLAAQRRVSAATQNQALNALVFMYREVVGGELGWIGEFERARRSHRVPLVLSQGEVKRLCEAIRVRWRIVSGQSDRYAKANKRAPGGRGFRSFVVFGLFVVNKSGTVFPPQLPLLTSMENPPPYVGAHKGGFAAMADSQSRKKVLV